RAIKRNDQRGLRVGLTSALIIGLLSLGLHVFHFLGLNFAPQQNAYASIYYTLAGLMAFTSLLAIALTLAVLLRAARGHFNDQFNVSVQHTAMVWNFVVVANVVTLAVMQLTPYLG